MDNKNSMDCKTVFIWDDDCAITIIFDRKKQMWSLLFRLIYRIITDTTKLNDKVFIRLRSKEIVTTK